MTGKEPATRVKKALDEWGTQSSRSSSLQSFQYALANQYIFHTNQLRNYDNRVWQIAAIMPSYVGHQSEIIVSWQMRVQLHNCG
jgi:hypothetical protein